ncbi:hypothetical protein TRFO_35614 [Tritrichomonas foetus]|uniref:IPT/TIG domain-containing protein n=1 Tax=Tritrichomonas foetus TaxID=1144522 RepID=A0A1J4JI92_9EUKA|nr:hypothetical protein TRFO_35614 [Tritrichomonas foetus]|eukprot:OHS98047.1 hypothetical protein TRFO_35614 [Tritrichomonas foetus]
MQRGLSQCLFLRLTFRICIQNSKCSFINHFEYFLIGCNMFWICMIRIIRVDSECPYNNTIMNSDGKCVCKPGYVAPSIITSHGCWTCSPICTYNALCHYPGLCKCKNGFKGDGITSCTPIYYRPVLIDYIPKESSIHSLTYVNVTFNLPINITVSMGYARFDFLVVLCSIVSPEQMKCPIPNHRVGRVGFDVSIDGQQWSESGMTFTFLPRKYSAFMIISIISLVLLTGILIFLLISFCIWRKKRKSPRAFIHSSKPIQLPSARFL